MSDQPTCERCKGRGTITYYPPRRDGAYPIPCPDCSDGTPDHFEGNIAANIAGGRFPVSDPAGGRL